MKEPKAVVILSGGMDSTAALFWAIGYNAEVHAVSFNYGQRHAIELQHAEDVVSFARNVYPNTMESHTIVDMTAINELMQGSGSVLVEHDIDVPEGHYAEETMAQTVVPNRNMIMMAIAAAKAISIGADSLVTGVHAGDHAVYPDCRPEFIDYMRRTLRVANEGFIDPGFLVVAPWLHVSKADIVTEGERLNVPWELTWTCYKGGVDPGQLGEDVHCGRCSTCVERLEAFSDAGVTDPVEYADREYWVHAVNAYAEEQQDA